MAKLTPDDIGKTPVVVNPFKRWQPDLNIPANQAARNSGIAIRQNNLAIEQQAAGLPVGDDMYALVNALKINSDIDISLKLLRLGFVGRVINLTAGVPAQIISKSKWPRGYIIINPAEVAGFNTTVTFFPSLLRAPATYTSAAFNVSGVDTVRLFLDVTAQAAGATLVVNAQTQDPLSGNWATTQADIFTGAAAIGTYYASIGTLGVDRQFRLEAVVGVNNETFSISGLFKGAANTPSGSTIYIGDSNVTAVIGYPILPGQREYFFLGDDVEVYAISPTEPLQIKVFQMQ